MAEPSAKDSVPVDNIGLGHMSDVPVAAFDPVFWLHHCNVDRLLAIWQKFNKDKWFDSPYENDPTPKTELQPFHYDTAGNIWFSEKCRNVEDLNYQYDDLVAGPDMIDPSTGKVDEQKYLDALREHIYELYPSTSKSIRNQPRYRGEAGFNDYIINVVYDRYALGGRAYSIDFFIGSPPERHSGRRQHENFVGTVYTFSSPIETAAGGVACNNCKTQQEEGILSKAQVSLTVPLLVKAQRHAQAEFSAANLGYGLDLEGDGVEGYLEGHLRWEFVELGGRLRDASEFPKTKVAVYKGVGAHPSGTMKLPSFRNYKLLTRATRGKRWGVDAGDPMIVEDGGE